MLHDKSLLIVGGSGRNVGKTEFICRLIEKISSKHDVYALKVSAVFPDEAGCHGDHSEDVSDYYLLEESRRDSAKDSSRMLRAGARSVFYLRSDNEGILNGFAAFRKKIPPGAVLLCESNSLVNYVKPGLFVLVKTRQGDMKPRVRSLLEAVDVLVESDGKSGFSELERIELDQDNSWVIIDKR